MQHKLILGTVLWGMSVMAGHGAYSAGIANRNAPDPLLGGPMELGPEKPGPCDTNLASSRYTPGTDVHGQRVVAADLPHVPMPGPQSIMVATGGALVELDPKAVLDRPAACPPQPKPRPAR
jgi:hypothetical protein